MPLISALKVTTTLNLNLPRMQFFTSVLGLNILLIYIIITMLPFNESVISLISVTICTLVIKTSSQNNITSTLNIKFNFVSVFCQYKCDSDEVKIIIMNLLICQCYLPPSQGNVLFECRTVVYRFIFRVKHHFYRPMYSSTKFIEWYPGKMAYDVFNAGTSACRWC